jgi:hypothetical protein
VSTTNSEGGEKCNKASKAAHKPNAPNTISPPEDPSQPTNINSTRNIHPNPQAHQLHQRTMNMMQPHMMDKSDSGGKLKTYVSINVRELLGISATQPTYDARIEVTFCYDVGGFMAKRGRFLPTDEQKRGILAAQDIRIPYTVTNATSFELSSETHMFRAQTGDSDDMWFNSMKSVPSEGSVLKKETYELLVTLGYHTGWKSAMPFDRSHLFVKLAVLESVTNSKDFHFSFDHGASKFNGFDRPVEAFFPCKAKYKPVVREWNDDAPRVYISMGYERHKLQSFLKFYLVPPLMFLLLVLRQLEVPDILSLGATLVLANVALLFVSHNRKFYWANTIFFSAETTDGQRGFIFNF